MPGLQEEIALALCPGGGREVKCCWLASDLGRMRNRSELDPDLPGVGFTVLSPSLPNLCQLSLTLRVNGSARYRPLPVINTLFD